MPRPDQLSKEDMAGFEEDGEEDDLPLPILKRKNVSYVIIFLTKLRPEATVTFVLKIPI